MQHLTNEGRLPVRSRLSRSLLRLAVLGAVTAGIVGIAPVRGQPADRPTLPRVNQTITFRQADPPPAPVRGLATTGRGASTQSRLGIPAANATTRACPNTNRAKS